MKYNKLVRDKIDSIIKGDNKIPLTRIADNKEFFIKLKEKLREEVNEFQQSSEVEELADILEVVYALANHQGISIEELNQIRIKKAEQRGLFTRRLILEEVQE